MIESINMSNIPSRPIRKTFD